MGQDIATVSRRITSSSAPATGIMTPKGDSVSRPWQYAGWQGVGGGENNVAQLN
jgi:hypothetical protein